MAVGAGEQNSPVSRGLARSTAPLERQGRAALEEDPAEESPAPGGEQVERSAGVDARLHHGVYGAQSNTSVSGSSDRPRIQHRRLSLSRSVIGALHPPRTSPVREGWSWRGCVDRFIGADCDVVNVICLSVINRIYNVMYC